MYIRCRARAEDETGFSRRERSKGEGVREGEKEERTGADEGGGEGESEYRKEGVGNARRRKEVVVRPCGSMKSKATLSPELPPFGNDVFRLPGARGINPICLPPSSRV